MKKIFEKIVPGSLSVDTRRVSTENAPEGDSKENFGEPDETFEITSNKKNRNRGLDGLRKPEYIAP